MNFLTVAGLGVVLALGAAGQWRRAEGQKPAQQPQPAAQEPSGQEPVIKVEVRLVNITCSVRDKNGRLVPNLSKDDFIVKEDGKPQTIRYFAHDTDVPLTLGLLVDVSPSQERLIDAEKKAASEFFTDVLRPKDLAFLVEFGGETELLQDYTNSPRLLRAALNDLHPNSAPGGIHPGPVPTVSDARGTVLFDAVYVTSSDQLKGQVGRKALVLITDGIDQGSKVKIQDAIRAAHMADAVIYAIDYFDPAAYQRSGWGFAPGDGDLKRMAEETGGRVFKVDRKHSLPDIFKQLQDELRSQYSIGYLPETSEAAAFHKIEVKTKSGDLKVQARKGYFSGKQDQ